jgi:hypothetical protein
MRHEDFNKTYDELGRKDRRLIDEALQGLTLRIEQGDPKYGSWHGALVKDLRPKCKCEDAEAIIVQVLIETREQTIDDTTYYVGDYKLDSGRAALGAPTSYTVGIPSKIERAFMREASALVLDKTWDAVAAIVPALAEVEKPDPEQARSVMFGCYAPREGAPIRLI